jgi:hypothetical protein
MISVIEVYNTVRDLCNKDQKGFVTPSVFNSFAEVAQQNIFSEMFKELVSSKQLRIRNVDSAGKDSIYRGVQDDLSNFVEQDAVDSNALGGTFADSNVFRRPENTARIISIVVNNTERTPVELVFESDKITHILSSNLSAPTASYPVALVSRSIEVFPTDVDSIVVNYYRQPASIYITNVGDFQSGDVDRTSGPRLVATASTAQSADFANSGFVVPDVSACRNFELPEHYKNEIISEIAKMIGVRLRDEFISTYGIGQTTNE